MSNEKNFEKHPCYNVKAKGKYGRVHLPVAPKCNIQCNYCNRKYDCVNESRPGVTSTLLSPEQARVYMDKVLEKEPRISVAGIAGPGDPFANPEETLGTMRLIKRDHPETILCLSTNGMNLAPYVPELAELGISHVTITLNAVDTEISQHIYAWVRDGKVLYRGKQGAELLLARQLQAIESLKQHGITVKVNTIIIPGVNDHHIPVLAARLKELGVDLHNCIAMIPNADTAFEHLEEPSKEMMNRVRKEAEEYVPQMRHCARCRADAVGLLDNDKTEEFRGCLSSCSQLPKPKETVRPYVAVATLEGVLVNQHLGEATRFQIWGEDGQGGYQVVEERPAPATGGGSQRWHNISRLLSDCRAVLVNDLGDSPKEILKKKGVQPVTMAGFIERGLEAVYTGRGLSQLQGRMRKCSSKGACAGGGNGCG
ncbi:nitrogenase cofactor biosynthesis protein NifB [Desulfobulbus rhabdoformis]|uniref:nitrogenase cofactor biosynthesis protein NifB n=1 Tax=Desulfobulbus rhabdoformis TaxID=34032 RepID=UPI0019624C9B|nr:nitrogenase cofactor biosynthesis protein NifB [Desulfobulbus rhabdoformis]MBM9616816.1 nitrogenase cofactor biosynthesis protein NifB [Desulfobulbus rhabdoformis]